MYFSVCYLYCYFSFLFQVRLTIVKLYWLKLVNIVYSYHQSSGVMTYLNFSSELLSLLNTMNYPSPEVNISYFSLFNSFVTVQNHTPELIWQRYLTQALAVNLATSTKRCNKKLARNSRRRSRHENARTFTTFSTRKTVSTFSNFTHVSVLIKFVSKLRT